MPYSMSLYTKTGLEASPLPWVFSRFSTATVFLGLTPLESLVGCTVVQTFLSIRRQRCCNIKRSIYVKNLRMEQEQRTVDNIGDAVTDSFLECMTRWENELNLVNETTLDASAVIQKYLAKTEESPVDKHALGSFHSRAADFVAAQMIADMFNMFVERFFVEYGDTIEIVDKLESKNKTLCYVKVRLKP